MPPVVFEEIETEIAPDRRGDAAPAGPQADAKEAAPLAENIRRELARIDMRASRVRAD